MIPGFFDISFFDYENFIGFDDGGQTMSDHEGGSSFHHIDHRLLDEAFGL